MSHEEACPAFSAPANPVCRGGTFEFQRKVALISALTKIQAVLAPFELAFWPTAGNNRRFMETHNDPASLLFKWWPQIEANKNRIIGGVVIIAVVVLIYSFISWRRETNQVEAGDAVTRALVTMPPGSDASQVANMYLGISDQYGGTMAGQRALMQGAAALFMQGKYADAQGDFQRYLDAHPDGEFAGQAALGVAKCLEAQNKLNDAAGAYQHVINDFPDPEAVVNAQFSLALVDLQQRNASSAAQLLQQVAQSDPYGVLGGEARQYLYNIESSRPAPSATPSAAPTMSTPPATRMPVAPVAPAAPAKPNSAPSAPFNLSH